MDIVLSVAGAPESSYEVTITVLYEDVLMLDGTLTLSASTTASGSTTRRLSFQLDGESISQLSSS